MYSQMKRKQNGNKTETTDTPWAGGKSILMGLSHSEASLDLNSPKTTNCFVCGDEKVLITRALICRSS